MNNITKRDVKIFVFGMLAMILFEVVYDWAAHVHAFKRGLNDGLNYTTSQNK